MDQDLQAIKASHIEAVKADLTSMLGYIPGILEFLAKGEHVEVVAMMQEMLRCVEAVAVVSAEVVAIDAMENPQHPFAQYMNALEAEMAKAVPQHGDFRLSGGYL